MTIAVVALSDARMTRALRTRMADVHGDACLWVRADVRDGIARLEGSVSSDAVRASVTITARRTPGVHEVVDGLRVASITRCSALDLDIAVDVENALRRLGPVFAGLTVDVSDGTVLLTGLLDRHSQRAAAVATARAVPGVADVLSAVVLMTHPSTGHLRPALSS